MTLLRAVLLFVLLQRGGELVLAWRNTAYLRDRGGVEIDPTGHKYFVALHAAWLAAMLIFAPADTSPSWPLLAGFLALQAARVWTIATLGRRWTTRLIVLPGTPPIRRGPYRWLAHPNYTIVIAELAILPLAFSAIAIAVLFTACNVALLARRIRLENAAFGRASYHIQETLPRRNAL